MKGAGEAIREAVTSWSGVEAVPHRFGGIEYRYGRKEMGHVHGDRPADLPLPCKLQDEVIATGRAQLHHVLPNPAGKSRRAWVVIVRVHQENFGVYGVDKVHWAGQAPGCLSALEPGQSRAPSNAASGRKNYRSATARGE